MKHIVPYENQIQQKFAQISLISNIYIFRRKLNNDNCIPSPLLMLYLKEILYQVLDWNNVYNRVVRCSVGFTLKEKRGNKTDGIDREYLVR